MEKRTDKLRTGLAAFDIFLNEEVLLRQLDFLDEMIRWSARINLTAIRNLEEGVEKHLLDSLVLLPYCQGNSLLDIGTGAGLPSIPLAIADSDLQVVSVESVGKKINFQKHIRRSLGLKNLTPLNCRVEELPCDRKFPLITARAFASIDKILELVQPLLTDEGELLLLRGAREEISLGQTEIAMQKHGFLLGEQHSYSLPFSGSQRQILRISRISQ
jgi:16S rRNA (guanine527-N7)-methyltransferase